MHDYGSYFTTKYNLNQKEQRQNLIIEDNDFIQSYWMSLENFRFDNGDFIQLNSDLVSIVLVHLSSL